MKYKVYLSDGYTTWFAEPFTMFLSRKQAQQINVVCVWQLQDILFIQW